MRELQVLPRQSPASQSALQTTLYFVRRRERGGNGSMPKISLNIYTKRQKGQTEKHTMADDLY